MSAGLPALAQSSGGVPKGYARLLVFDADSTLVSSQTQQLSAAAALGYETLQLRVTVEQDGYVTAYVGTESDVDVYFDDVTVEHRPGLLVQEVEYDPWGLSLAGLTASSPGLKRLNQYQYNGKEQQSDLGLNWADYGARMYNSQLGRWPVIDPLAEKWHVVSPFSYALNNPMLFVDPDGRDNVIYLQAQKSSEQDISRSELRGIARQANANFKALHLETRVRLSRGPVDYSRLAKTDAVAVIGRGSDVIGAVGKMNKGFAAELKSYKFGADNSDNPEISQNDQGQGGNIIAMDSRSISQVSRSLGVSKEAYGGFVINHGAGHNAGLWDAKGIVKFKNRYEEVPEISVMAGGRTQAAMMRGPEGVNSLINTPDNLDSNGVIQGKFHEHFGEHVSTPHLPTLPE